MIKSLTFELPAITVSLDVQEGLSEKDVLALGQKELVKQITKQFPKGFRYGISEGKVVSESDIVAGRPVKMKSSGTLGIIYEVKPGQKYPIKVVLENGVLQNCTPAALETVSKQTKIDKLIKGREEWEKTIGWHTGKTAFFVNGEDIIPAVINESRGKVKAVIVSHESNGSFYTLNPLSQKRLFDTYIEAEQFLKKH